jgi:hypothetical protein
LISIQVYKECDGPGIDCRRMKEIIFLRKYFLGFLQKNKEFSKVYLFLKLKVLSHAYLKYPSIIAFG